MSDAQLVGAFVLVVIALLLVGRWLGGRSPASLYRDEPITLTDAQWRELLLLDVKPRTKKPLRADYNKNFSDRRNAS